MDITRNIILIIILVVISQTIKGSTYFNTVNHQCNTSPAPMAYSVLFTTSDLTKLN